MSYNNCFTAAPPSAADGSARFQCLHCPMVLHPRSRTRHVLERHPDLARVDDARLGQTRNRRGAESVRGGPATPWPSPRSSVSGSTAFSSLTAARPEPLNSTVQSRQFSSSSSSASEVGAESEVRRAARQMLSQCREYSTSRLQDVARTILPGASDQFIRAAVWLIDEAARFVTATQLRCKTAEMNRNEHESYRRHRAILDTWNQGVDNPLDERFGMTSVHSTPLLYSGPAVSSLSVPQMHAVNEWRVASAKQASPPTTFPAPTPGWMAATPSHDLYADGGFVDAPAPFPTKLKLPPVPFDHWSRNPTHAITVPRTYSPSDVTRPVSAYSPRPYEQVTIPGTPVTYVPSTIPTLPTATPTNKQPDAGEIVPPTVTSSITYPETAPATETHRQSTPDALDLVIEPDLFWSSGSSTESTSGRPSAGIVSAVIRPSSAGKRARLQSVVKVARKKPRPAQ